MVAIEKQEATTAHQTTNSEPRQKSHQFGKDHKSLTDKDWGNFIFLDETPFSLLNRLNPQNDVVWVLKNPKCQIHLK